MGRKHLNKVIELNISLAGIVVFTKMNKLVWINLKFKHNKEICILWLINIKCLEMAIGLLNRTSVL